MTAERLSMADAFASRHSTRNFNEQEWSDEKQSAVEQIVAEVNALPRIFGGDVEVVLAPRGFGFLNFIVHESGWLMAKQPITEDPVQLKKNSLETGYLLETCIMKMTQCKIATCWIAGTYKAKKCVTFCGGNCSVPGVVAFGGEGQDRWLDKTVKFFGSFRGKNGYKDKFYDLKAGKPITEEDAGERLGICSAIASIPCGMKPHAFRVSFDEPNVHIYNMPQSIAMMSLMADFDMGNVIANTKLYYESQGQTVHFVMDGLKPEGENPLGGVYVCTAVLGSQ